MPFLNSSELQDFLLYERLVEPDKFREAIASCRSSDPTPAEVIKALESRGALTSYQAMILQKGERDGLRLGPYKLLYRNAAGSFARVFRGCSVETGESIGLKVLRGRYASDQRVISLFRREGELGKRLKHKNIVPIYEVGCAGDQNYITMEFVEGGNFKDFMKIRGKFPPEEATKYILDMAEGLEYALSLGLTHRDLKLSNVLLTAQRVAKLVDFGLAGNEGPSAGIPDETDRAVEYGAIERHTNAPDGDPRSDLYFLGAMYYELLTGTPPYPPTKNVEERKQISRYRNVRPISSVDPTLPNAIVEVVDRLMRINPFERYQTPTELIADLRAILGEKAPAPPAPAESKPAVPTVLCIESRTKQQDALREYFTKHGYRVLMLSTVERALARLTTNPPSGIVMTSETVEEDLAGTYQKAAQACGKAKVPLVLVLSKKESPEKANLPEHDHTRVLAQPATLRDIRSALEEMLPTYD